MYKIIFIISSGTSGACKCGSDAACSGMTDTCIVFFNYSISLGSSGVCKCGSSTCNPAIADACIYILC